MLVRLVEEHRRGTAVLFPGSLLGLPEWNARADAFAAPENKKDMLTSVGSRRRKETPHVRRQ